MDKQQIKRFSDITPDMIQDWKAKYGEYALSEISVPLTAEEDGPQAKFVMRVPDRHTALAMAQQKDEEKATNMLLANTVLGGDMEELDKYAFVWGEVVRAATNMIEAKGASVKKL